MNKMRSSKKGYSILVAMLLALQGFSLSFGATAPILKNQTAIVAAVRWAPVGFAWSGNMLQADTNYGFDGKGITSWGRTGFPMPDAALAVSAGYNVRATSTTTVTPVYYSIFYLNKEDSDKGPRLSDKCYAVIDSAGQIWLDTDGNFNDCRYYGYSNPNDPNYKHDPDPSVQWDDQQSNRRCFVDPLSSNNTQGPYFILPTKLDGSRQIFYNPNTNVYFRYDKEIREGFIPDPLNLDPPILTRIFQLGWSDLPDFPLLQDREGSTDFPIIPALGTTLKPRQVGNSALPRWDVGLSLKPFVNDFDADFEVGEEWHAENINTDNRYTPAEWIYRRTNPALIMPLVASGDFRLTDVVALTANGEPRIYRAGTTVFDNPPLGVLDPGDDLDVGRAVISFNYNGTISSSSELHTENVNRNNLFDAKEFIYRKNNSDPSVADVDIQLTSVNTNQHSFANANAEGICSLGGLYSGDLLILVELLQAGSASPTYDVVVESDMWMGQTPSTAAASIFDPFGHLLGGTQSINKATSLDPAGLPYSLASTTFFNIKPDFRSYFGLSIFTDNGVDNNLGPTNDTVPLNASNDFYPAKKCELFVGAVGALSCPDAGRTVPPLWGGDGLIRFSSMYRTIDTGTGLFGCNRTIYKKGRNLGTVVEAGDTRLTEVTGTRGGNSYTYKAGSIVTPGDLDAGTTIVNLPATLCFYDVSHGVNPVNGEYDPGEDLYDDVNNNMIIDYGDVRMSPISIGYYSYSCADVVDEWDVWVHEAPLHGISRGFCGSPTAIDIPVIPGEVGLDVWADRALRVEQTSKVKIRTNLILKKGDKVYVTLRNVTTRGKLPWEQTRVITAEAREIEFEVTPYQGSLYPNGLYDPIVVTAFADLDGPSTRPMPPNGPYQDPFYFSRYMPSANIQDPPNINVVPVPWPQPAVPVSVENNYDAWERGYLKVRTERLEIASTRKCFEMLEERYPNVSLETYDADNVIDVNDPCCIPFSLGKNLINAVLFNVSGGGISYMATAVGGNGQRYIIQYNNDHTYYFWYWNDIGPFPGVFDSGDYLGDNPGYVPPNFVGTQKPIEVSAQSDLTDVDNSGRFAANWADDDGFFPWGIVTKHDWLGLFDGETMDPKTGVTFGEIETYGVPTLITSFGTFTDFDYGGWALGMVKPKEPKQMRLRISSVNVLFDYNSTLKVHNTNFVIDDHLALDYSGYVTVKVMPVDARVNFSEFQVVDHGLQFSQLDYTAGKNSINQLPLPVPQIQHPYNPILRNLQDDFRTYTGGQSHIGRIIDLPFTRGLVHGWNSYPAIWSEWGQRYNKSPEALGKDPEDDKEKRKVNFNKLGTEFFPVTDYGFYFVLKDGFGNHLTFNPGTPSHPTSFRQLIKNIRVTGQFKRPLLVDPIKGRVTTDFAFGGMVKLPINYDYSGVILVDNSNYQWFEYPGKNWIGETGFGPDTLRYLPDEYNKMLLWNRRLDYTGVSNVILIDELTPTGHGEINIEVTLFDGTVKKFQDCCSNKNDFGIKMHGLTISGLPEKFAADQDYHLQIKLTEDTDMQVVKECNDAFLYLWQDRGIDFKMEGMDEPLHIGMGDGRTIGTPLPTRTNPFTGGAMYPDIWDFNDNGKISFGEHEIEIIGTYDLATNSWVGGMVDGRTFNVNGGVYPFDLTKEADCQLTEVGMDIGGINVSFMRRFMTPADHVISDNELCPVYVTAYKYGDDNNDRSYAPYYYHEWFESSYTHEVYLAGEQRCNLGPAEDLSVQVSPQPLTAGVVNELVDPSKPFTVKVTDANGIPVNLLEGVRDMAGDNEVPPERAQLHLFKDWHPDQQDWYGPGARLPQYYWVRTDLQNVSYDYYSNLFLFSDYRDEKEGFQPIVIDFDNAHQGIYVFKGFCANDAGEFMLTVYSPDRKHMGSTKVRIELPIVEYNIANIDDKNLKSFASPGEPDFLMTAGANYVYEITATCKNRQGKLLKQPPKNVRVCNDVELFPAHFTPFINIPANWRPRQWWPCERYDTDYSLHFGLDYNNDGLLQQGSHEIYSFGGFKSRREFLTYDEQLRAVTVFRRNQPIIYNTGNVHFSDNTFSPRPSVMLQPGYKPTPDGWGLGCIYNSPYDGAYLFVDIVNDGVLDYKDFLNLDELGTCKFYVFAEDVCNVGGLVGCNPYSAGRKVGDVAGAPMPYFTDPGFLYMRYRYFLQPGPLDSSEMGSRDGTFALDWDAMSATTAAIRAPKLVMKSAESGLPLGSSLYDPGNYDLAYSYNNRLLIEAHPADDRDLGVPNGGFVVATGSNDSQLSAGSFFSNDKSNPPTTYLMLRPTGQGKGVIEIGYRTKNTSIDTPPYYFSLKDSPQYYSIYPISMLDSSPGLQPTVFAPSKILNEIKNAITIQVFDRATNALVKGANVRIRGDGIDSEGTTDDSGKVTLEATPKSTTKLVITATAEGFVEGETVVYTGDSDALPRLEVEPYPALTNKPQFSFKGYTNPGATVAVNGKAVQVASDGSFIAKTTLIEGANFIQIIASLTNNKSATLQISVTLDTVKPAIILPSIPELIGAQEFTLLGRVEPGCKVRVNGQDATIVYDIFQAKLSVTPGRNEVKIEVTDPAGNISTETMVIPVYGIGWGKLIMGQTEVYNEKGEVLGKMQASPTKVGLVPIDSLRVIFGASFSVNDVIKTCKLDAFGQSFVFEAGSKTVLVNADSKTLPNAPELINGVFYLTPEILKETLSCTLTVDTVAGQVIIEKVWLP